MIGHFASFSLCSLISGYKNSNLACKPTTYFNSILISCTREQLQWNSFSVPIYCSHTFFFLVKVVIALIQFLLQELITYLLLLMITPFHLILFFWKAR